MSDAVAVAAEIPAELDQALDRLASSRGQSKSALIREALQFYVQNEADFVAAVEEGLAAAQAGDLIDNDEAMRQIDELLSTTP